jgi:hypothetical protein
MAGWDRDDDCVGPTDEPQHHDDARSAGRQRRRGAPLR